MRGPTVKANLRSIRYNAGTQQLEIEFPAGGLCQYYGVPAEVYEALMTAGDREEYFEKNIRFRFRHRHILEI